MEDKKKIVVICGPTATGKTSLSIKLARDHSGEIISADALQVYRNLNIGTAKATADELKAARHHLVDILEPDEEFNVRLFCDLAKDAVEDICSRGNVPFIVGGTGLYIESFLKATSFAEHEEDRRVRRALKRELDEKGRDHLYKKLVSVDPDYAGKVHPNNTVRVLRALEIYTLTGYNMSYHIRHSRLEESPYDQLLIGLTFKDRSALYDRINRRIDLMVESGIIDEARYVYDNRESFTTSANAIGYKEFFPLFEGCGTVEKCVEELKKASRHYAKRQLTWFNRMDGINWLYVEDPDLMQKAEEMLSEFLSR